MNIKGKHYHRCKICGDRFSHLSSSERPCFTQYETVLHTKECIHVANERVGIITRGKIEVYPLFNPS